MRQRETALAWWTPRRTMRWCAAGVVLFACGDFGVEAESLDPFPPPPVYQVWWDQLEDCVGLRGEFREIRWYVGDAVTLDGADVFGVWAAPRTIVLERFYLRSESAVKHEMLHHLTNGTMPHSNPAFTRCATTSESNVTTP